MEHLRLETNVTPAEDPLLAQITEGDKSGVEEGTTEESLSPSATKGDAEAPTPPPPQEKPTTQGSSTVTKVTKKEALAKWVTTAGNFIQITPPIGTDDYWLARVWISKFQAVEAFPKFGQIGIGFKVEKKDWNTNLPHTKDAVEIFRHIKKNKGVAVSDERCIAAIRILQAWVNKTLRLTENLDIEVRAQ